MYTAARMNVPAETTYGKRRVLTNIPMSKNASKSALLCTSSNESQQQSSQLVTKSKNTRNTNTNANTDSDTDESSSSSSSSGSDNSYENDRYIDAVCSFFPYNTLSPTHVHETLKLVDTHKTMLKKIPMTEMSTVLK